MAGFSSEGPVTLPVILFNSGSKRWKSPVAMTFLQQTLLNSGWWQQSSLGDSGAHTPVTAPPAGQSSAHKRWDQLNTQIHSLLSILSVISFSPPRYLFKQHLKGKAWHLEETVPLLSGALEPSVHLPMCSPELGQCPSNKGRWEHQCPGSRKWVRAIGPVTTQHQDCGCCWDETIPIGKRKQPLEGGDTKAA